MMNIVKSFKINLLALLVLSFFAACKKDAATPNPIEGDFSLNNSVQQIVSRSTDPESEELCFELGYPITIALPDGTNQTAESEEELSEIYNDWFEQNPNANTCPAIVYPITVVNGDGTTQSVASEEELIGLLTACIEIDLGWEDCFTIQYPVTVLFPDGTSTTVNNDDELAYAMYNSGSVNDSLYPTIQFPITVVKSDGTTVLVENEDGLNAIFEECYGIIDEPIEPCFEYVFPVNVDLPDGTTATANDDEELAAIFNEWFENNPCDSTTTSFPVIAYPLNLLLTDGSVVTVNSDEELMALFENCYGDGGGLGIEDCLSFNYPITIVLPDGVSAAVNSDDELMNTVMGWFEENPDSEEEPTLDYPVSVTLTADGSVVTVNSDEELDAIFNECYEGFAGASQHLVLGGKDSVASKAAMKQYAKHQIAKRQVVERMLGKRAK